MRSYLPIGIEELLGGAVESARLELKAAWDPEVTGHQVLKTLCAFANDLQNLNGGYVLLGVAEKEGVAVRPVRGSMMLRSTPPRSGFAATAIGSIRPKCR